MRMLINTLPENIEVVGRYNSIINKKLKNETDRTKIIVRLKKGNDYFSPQRFHVTIENKLKTDEKKE